MDSADQLNTSLEQTSLNSPPRDRNQDKADTLTLRALVNTRDAGVIIGKGGKNVAELRERTGVRAGVTKAVPGVVDRVLSVIGTVDGISQAYETITLQLIEQSLADDSGNPPNNTAIAMTVRLLVAHNVMGSVIGKQGARIKSIQDDCGVRMIAQKEMLPQSTERVVEVTGTAAAIGKAIGQIAACLLSDQDRAQGTIFFHPGSIGSEGPAAAMYSSQNGGASVLNTPPQLGYVQPPPNNFYGIGLGAAPRGGGGPGRRSATYNQGPAGRAFIAPRFDRRVASNPNLQPGQVSIGPDGTQQRAPSSSHNQTEDPNLRTQNISLPGDMVGCIIVSGIFRPSREIDEKGRGGSKIAEIRRLSGSRINISKEANAETGERLFSIVGTTENNEKALFLLYSSLEAEKERRTTQGTQDAPI